MKRYMGLILSVAVFMSLFFITGCSANDVAPFLDKITNFGGWAAVGTVVTAIVELVVRMWPTANPTSLFLVLASILHSVGALCSVISQFLDGILQNSSKDILVKK